MFWKGGCPAGYKIDNGLVGGYAGDIKIVSSYIHAYLAAFGTFTILPRVLIPPGLATLRALFAVAGPIVTFGEGLSTFCALLAILSPVMSLIANLAAFRAFAAMPGVISNEAFDPHCDLALERSFMEKMKE